MMLFYARLRYLRIRYSQGWLHNLQGPRLFALWCCSFQSRDSKLGLIHCRKLYWNVHMYTSVFIIIYWQVNFAQMSQNQAPGTGEPASHCTSTMIPTWAQVLVSLPPRGFLAPWPTQGAHAGEGTWPMLLSHTACCYNSVLTALAHFYSRICTTHPRNPKH